MPIIKFTSVIAFLLFCLQTSFAGTLPRGCEVVGFSFVQNNLILNDKGDQTFYLIQNHAENQVTLERIEAQEAFMSPKLTTKLDSARAAAFASDVQDLNFQCFMQVEGKPSVVNCAEMLDVCQYPRAKFPLSNMGNYWISTNKAAVQVIKDAAAKGILLRW